MSTPAGNYRILVVDDNQAIHDDFRKILGVAAATNADAPPAAAVDLSSIEDALFGDGDPAAPPSAAAPSRAAFEIDSAYQGQDGFSRVERARQAGRPYAVAFVDMRMPPGWDGLRTVREIWRCDPDINIVVCTAFSDHSWAEIESVAGAGDRLLVLKKPFEPIEVRRLAATLTAKWTLGHQAAMKLAELERAVAARTQELNRIATHDRLTHLPNRTLFHERLTAAMDATRADGTHDLAVLFLDFDRFKLVNDSLGHAGGDDLLRGIATRLTAALRDTDTVSSSTDGSGGVTARFGGDEFCVMLTGLRDGPRDAGAVAQRLLDALAVPYDIMGCRVQSTASIGVALLSAGYATADEMIRDADTAMYRAKAAGKARAVLFDATMHEQTLRRLTLETELRQAIAGGEMEVHYQPVVHVESARSVGAEALVRWRHPTRGLVPPADFVPVAEETGLIEPLGLWVLEESARQLAAWSDEYPDAALTVSVNVSTRQLADPLFVNKVAAVLARTGADARRLILEITETALVADSAAAAATIRGLQELGLRIYLDDFGTGYSSLSMLHQFPLDGLKIDRSFIRAASDRRQFAAIVHAVLELAHNLNMDVVAEGVETQEQLTLLQCLRCERAQGFLFSKPIAAGDFEAAFLREQTNFVVARSIAA